jgi:hypothetical protein
MRDPTKQSKTKITMQNIADVVNKSRKQSTGVDELMNNFDKTGFVNSGSVQQLKQNIS